MHAYTLVGIFFYNAMVVKNLLLYTSKCEGKGQKYSPFCAFI